MWALSLKVVVFIALITALQRVVLNQVAVLAVPAPPAAVLLVVAVVLLLTPAMTNLKGFL